MVPVDCIIPADGSDCNRGALVLPESPALRGIRIAAASVFFKRSAPEPCADAHGSGADQFSAPGRDRTCSLRFRRPPLFRIALQTHGSPCENRTHMFRLRAWDPAVRRRGHLELSAGAGPAFPVWTAGVPAVGRRKHPVLPGRRRLRPGRRTRHVVLLDAAGFTRESNPPQFTWKVKMQIIAARAFQVRLTGIEPAPPGLRDRYSAC